MQAISGIIGADNAPCAVALEGRILGSAPACVLLPEDGCCHIGVHPLVPGFFGITRAFSFEAGRLKACPSDVSAYLWPGGPAELVFTCPESQPSREPAFPHTLARRAFSGALAVLYEENGVWLAFEQNGRAISGCRVCAEADTGELFPFGHGLAAIARGADGAVCVLVDDRFAPTARYRAETAETDADGRIVLMQRAGLRAGYGRRLTVAGGGAAAIETEEYGLFGSGLDPNCPLPMRFLEAVMTGLYEIANGMLAPAFRMSEAGYADFFGAFGLVRPHPAEARTAGTGMPEPGTPTQMQAYQFETDGDFIVNILTES